MDLRVGTSGFAYKEWKGSFYPPDLPDGDMLRFYAARLRAVEINNTFYRMPAPALLERWAGEVAPGFLFVLKTPRQITHLRRLKDVGEPLAHFLRVASVLGERQGAILVQLPPNLKKDLARLSELLALLPPRPRAALEFRHASWFDEDVLAALRSRDVALVAVDGDDELEVPFVPTARWGYLRLRRVAYDDDALRAWAARVAAAGWEQAFVFFKHEDEATGPRLAARFAALAAAAGPG